MEQNLENNPELLAPAGDFDMLKYAVSGGANAVYLGLTEFNARSKAKNFTMDELADAVLYCHKRGVRVYLALNTLMKDSELGKVLSAAQFAFKLGIDAVLVQDFALLFAIKNALPDLPIHASTQMGVHNALGAIYAKKLGIDRVVLSREVILSDVESITKIIETEMFIHGAMCVAFSGNCYFSSIVSGYSGNRGKCLQLCRKKYKLWSDAVKKTGYMLSPKDISMVRSLGRLRGAGVHSFKIEGRLRSNEYAFAVSDVYSRALKDKGKSRDIEQLKSVFNRGDFSTAYIEDDKADVIYDNQQNNIGAYAGKVVSVKPLKIKGYNILPGDGFKFMRHGREVTGGVIVGDSAHLTKSGGLAAEALARVKSDSRHEEEISPLKAINDLTVDRLINIPYKLTEKCVIIKADENTDSNILKQADVIIYSPQRYDIETARAFIMRTNKQVLLDIPIIARGKDVSILSEIVYKDIFDGYVANNIFALELCREKPIILGTGMNSLSHMDEPKIASIESAVYEQTDIIYSFGRYPLMTLSHPIGKNASLTDDTGNTFLLRKKQLYYEYHELLNSKITNLFPKLDRNKHKRVLIDCAGIDAGVLSSVISHLYDTAFNDKNHTYGRYGKGVK